MKIQFVGTGGAFDYKYGNSSAIVDHKGERYLVDCGHEVYSDLRKKDAVEEIDHILITHFHSDHVGSLSTFILHHHHFVKGKQLKIFYPEKHFKDALYNYLSHSLLKPEKFIALIPLENRDGIDYINTFGKHVPGMQTYGYVFQEDAETMVYSGDTGDSDDVFEYLEDHPPEKMPTVFHDITFDRANKSHTFYRELEEHMDQCNIYGYHCNPELNTSDNPIPLVYDHSNFLL